MRHKYGKVEVSRRTQRNLVENTVELFEQSYRDWAVYFVERNDLTAEQRRTIEQILQELEERCPRSVVYAKSRIDEGEH